MEKKVEAVDECGPKQQRHRKSNAMQLKCGGKSTLSGQPIRGEIKRVTSPFPALRVAEADAVEIQPDDNESTLIGFFLSMFEEWWNIEAEEEDRKGKRRLAMKRD